MSRSRIQRSFDHLKHTPGLARDSSVLVGLVVIGLLSGGYILSQQRVSYPWDNNYTFVADFDEVPGISPGNGQEVRIAGVPVGDIVAADVTEAGKARLTLTIEDDDQRVYDNARLVLRPKSPLNEMYVEIAPGGPPGAPLPSGGLIPVHQTEDPEQVDEVLQHLDEESRTAIASLLAEADAALASAAVALPPGLEAADGTLTALQPVVEQLATRRENVRLLVTALSDIATVTGSDDARLTTLVANARDTLAVLDRSDAQLDASLDLLPGVTDELRRATSAVSALTGELDPALTGLSEAADVLPSALNDLRTTVGTLDRTLDDAAPVLREARPLVADLRPLVADLRPVLGDVEAITTRLDVATAQLVDYLPDLKDFVYNTSSVMSLEDANGGILRGLLQFSQDSLPAALPSIDGQKGGTS